MVVGDKITVARQRTDYAGLALFEMLVMKISSRQIRYGDGTRILGRVKLRNEGITWVRGHNGRVVDAFLTTCALR